MKRVKKLLTLMLAVMMMLSMTIISSAAEKSAVITITGAGEGATFTYAQVIKADTSKATGWAIVPGYERLFASFGDDEQSQIEGYIAASESVRAAAIKAANVSTSDVFTNPMTVSKAGLYLINGTEEGYDYNPMLAYVGFDDKTGEEKGLVDTTIKAKKTPKTVGKTVDEQTDKFVQVGDEVTYTLTATIPYSPKGSQTTLVITDELTGGEFKVNDAGKAVVTVDVGDAPTMEITPDGNKLTIDLASLIINSEDPKEDNKYANMTVTLTYVAIVTGTEIENKAYIGNNPATVVKSYTGKLKITKMNEAGSNALAGAGFVVVNADGKFATLEGGVLTGWVDTADDATTITTGSDGTATVEGFDANKTYKFHEVVAPEGYKINDDDVTAEWKPGQADNAQIAEATMNDLKLDTLPFTGGKGTAAFTGFGVLLMSISAGLYFTNKKNKSAK
ncbi:MAG: SpaH/EbpB family LPXTG-anchored major pilin [Pseudobutyrivibrio sp.]|nr:SpaH/EbpB family LPXTG-anchored major pilin [Pseudobutyrivibrio sp.]